jgi:hypothetical protein
VQYEGGMEFVADLSSVREYFGAEPVLEYKDVPYYENVVKIEAELENGSVWFTYMPCQAWAELRLVAKPFSVVALRLADISHMFIRKTEEDHTLLIRFARKQTNNLKLYLRPRVLLFWGNEAPAPEGGADLELK